MKSKHTPTPWIATMDENLQRPYSIIASVPRHRYVADLYGDDDTARADRDFIVLAVNSHARLVAALKQIVLDGCEDIQAETPFPDTAQDAGSTTCLDRGHRAMACNACIARAALAQAEGK